MNVWILYKKSQENISPEAYEINRFVAEAKRMNINLSVIAPEELDILVTKEGKKSIHLRGKETTLPDFLLPRMGSGTTYYALAVMRHLERMGVKCYNGSQSVDIVKDKLYAHQILAQANVPIPKTMLAKHPIDIKWVEESLGFPVVVKRLCGSQGKGIYLSKDKYDFKDIIGLISEADNLIIQEYVKSSHGRDIRVFIIGGEIIGVMERSSTTSFKANFSAGGSVKKIDINPEIERLSLQSASVLGLDITGVDLLYSGEGYYVCEANSSPGFEGLESCHEGLNVPQKIFEFLMKQVED